MDVALQSLGVSASRHADPRACLRIERTVPAGFQRIEVDVRLEATDGVDPAQVRMLTTTAEHCCVVLQTLRGDVPVTTTIREPTGKTAAA